jgi:hypothetical protein
VFKVVTLFFSKDSPNLTAVIPAMDYIDEVLTTQSINNVTFEPAIRIALSLSKKSLNRSYNRTDDSELYRAAIGTFIHYVN